MRPLGTGNILNNILFQVALFFVQACHMLTSLEHTAHCTTHDRQARIHQFAGLSRQTLSRYHPVNPLRRPAA